MAQPGFGVDTVELGSEKPVDRSGTFAAVTGVQFAAGQYVASDRIDQRTQQRAGGASRNLSNQCEWPDFET